VVVWAAVQVGDFMSMVIGNNYGRFKNKHLGLLLKKKIGVKKGRKSERPFFIRPKNKKKWSTPCKRNRELKGRLLYQNTM
jgi:hypothetical protein